MEYTNVITSQADANKLLKETEASVKAIKKAKSEGRDYDGEPINVHAVIEADEWKTRKQPERKRRVTAPTFGKSFLSSSSLAIAIEEIVTALELGWAFIYYDLDTRRFFETRNEHKGDRVVHCGEYRTGIEYTEASKKSMTEMANAILVTYFERNPKAKSKEQPIDIEAEVKSSAPIEPVAEAEVNPVAKEEKEEEVAMNSVKFDVIPSLDEPRTSFVELGLNQTDGQLSIGEFHEELWRRHKEGSYSWSEGNYTWLFTIDAKNATWLASALNSIETKPLYHVGVVALGDDIIVRGAFASEWGFCEIEDEIAYEKGEKSLEEAYNRAPKEVSPAVALRIDEVKEEFIAEQEAEVNDVRDDFATAIEAILSDVDEDVDLAVLFACLRSMEPRGEEISVNGTDYSYRAFKTVYEALKRLPEGGAFTLDPSTVSGEEWALRFKKYVDGLVSFGYASAKGNPCVFKEEDEPMARYTLDDVIDGLASDWTYAYRSTLDYEGSTNLVLDALVASNVIIDKETLEVSDGCSHSLRRALVNKEGSSSPTPTLTGFGDVRVGINVITSAIRQYLLSNPDLIDEEDKKVSSFANQWGYDVPDYFIDTFIVE